MSETTTDSTDNAAPQETEQQAPGAETAETQVSQDQGTETQAQEQEPPKPEPKPKRTDRHIAHLTAAKTAAERRAEDAERRAAAAEALLRSGETEQPAPRQPQTTNEDAIQAEVNRRELNRRLTAIDTTGKREFGETWETAKATITGLGGTDNAAFLEALTEAENPAKVFAALADDPDTLVDLLSQTPARIAARITRMDTEIARTPAAKPLSSAPTPARRVAGTAAVLPDFDPYNVPKNMSMAEWNRSYDKWEKARRAAR